VNSDDLGDESDASDVAGLGQTVLRQDLLRYGQATFLTWSTLKFRKDHNLCPEVFRGWLRLSCHQGSGPQVLFKTKSICRFAKVVILIA
jgi:hypothetical protein